MTKLRVLSAADVRTCLPMKVCIEVVADAMRAASAGRIALHARMLGPLCDRSGFLGVMPGSALVPAVFGAKIAGILPHNPHQGRPAIQGFVALFDHDTGAPVALVEAGELTAIRTGAASGLATRLLARPDARSHGILGTGVQAYSHARAVIAARPDVEQTLIWGRSPDKAASVAAALQAELGRVVRPVTDAAEVAAADIISTVTGATTPLLFGAEVRPGAHVNLAGAHRPMDREADAALLQAGSLFVDLRAGALQDAGDILLAAAEGAITTDALVEIGLVADGKAGGRRDASEITIYKSVGTVAQDLYAAHTALLQAQVLGLGAVVDL